MPPAGEAADAEHHDDVLLRYIDIDKLLDAARRGEVNLVDGRYLIRWFETGKGKVLRRQEMPPEAFLPADVLTRHCVDSGDLELFALSYCWVARDHPDEASFHLRKLVKVLKAFLSGSKPAWSVGEEGFTNLSNFGLEAAGYSFGASKPDTSIGVFWDFLSLPQKPFIDDAEKNIFKLGLGSINALYGHPAITKLILPDLPPGTDRSGYDQSGWTRFELEVANLATPPHRLVRLDGPYAQKLFSASTTPQGDSSADDVPGDAWIKLVLEGGKRISRRGPRPPEDFARELGSLRFTNGADQGLVTKKYHEAFANVVTHATDYSANGFDLDTEAMRSLLQLLQEHCDPEALRSVNLGNNTQAELSLAEISEHLCDFKQLEKLDLMCCNKVHGGLATIAAQLPQLRALILDNCSRVTGDLEDLKPLGAHLETLDLSRCSEVGGTLNGLLAACAPTLRQLKLWRCSKVRGALSCLAGHTQLRVLALSGIGDGLEGDLEMLAQLAELRQLRLGGCRKISGELRQLGLHHPKLQVLDLGLIEEGLEGDLEMLAPLAELQVLLLVACKKITGELSHLGLHHPKLQVLYLSLCHRVVGNVSSLAALTQLREVNLWDCKDVDGDLGSLSPLTDLRTLDLTGCRKIYGQLPQEGVEIRGYDNANPRPAPSSSSAIIAPSSPGEARNAMSATAGGNENGRLSSGASDANEGEQQQQQRRQDSPPCEGPTNQQTAATDSSGEPSQHPAAAAQTSSDGANVDVAPLAPAAVVPPGSTSSCCSCM